MTTYAMKKGSDQALIDLVTIAPLPLSNGLEYARRSFALNGDIADEYPHVNLLFDQPLTITQLQTIYTQFGFDTAQTVDITMLVPDDNFDDQRMNGIAVRPRMGVDGKRRGFFVYGLTILVRNLQTVSV